MKSPHTETDSRGRIRSHLDSGIGWLTIDNAQKRNAISKEMWLSLIETLKAFEVDPDVRCVIVRGAGEQAFCSGADISEKKRVVGAASGELNKADVGLQGLEALRMFSKPMIAMINGYCLGAGFAIALTCDLRYSSIDASFGIPAARLGIAYRYSEIRALSQLVGPAEAKRILFTADRLSADAAREVGLLNQVVPMADLAQVVTAVARRIASNAPLSVRAAKMAVAAFMANEPQDQIAECDALAKLCLSSEDHAEGLSAFRERRVPTFKGA